MEVSAVHRMNGNGVRPRNPDVVEFHCSKCGQVVAMTNGVHMFAGGCAFPMTVTMICVYCKQVLRWKPVLGFEADY